MAKLRTDIKAVDTNLRQYGFLESSEEEEKSEDDPSLSRGKLARSGKMARITNHVINPQIWSGIVDNSK